MFIVYYVYSTGGNCMYFDPGTGSLIIQMILAALASGGAVFFAFRNKVKPFLAKKKRRNPMEHENKQTTSSFRDPAGFLFVEDGILYRHINEAYLSQFNMLMNSGLYKELTTKKFLIPHQEEKTEETDNYIIIKPDKIPFVSYPYEWSFEQYKDAALATLRIHRIALDLNDS